MYVRQIASKRVLSLSLSVSSDGVGQGMVVPEG